MEIILTSFYLNCLTLKHSGVINEGKDEGNSSTNFRIKGII